MSSYVPAALTLSQPGGHIIPTQYYKPPGFSNLATALRDLRVRAPMLMHSLYTNSDLLNKRAD